MSIGLATKGIISTTGGGGEGYYPVPVPGCPPNQETESVGQLHMNAKKAKQLHIDTTSADQVHIRAAGTDEVQPKAPQTEEIVPSVRAYSLPINL